MASRLLEERHGATRLGYLAHGEVDKLLTEHPTADGWQVLKSHDGGECFAKALAERRAVALYAYRDMRDVAFSLAHKLKLPFDVVVGRERLLHQCLETFDFWTSQPRTLVQRYEEIVVDSERAVREIAEHLELEVSDDEISTIAADCSISKNKQRTEQLRQKLESLGIDLSNRESLAPWDEASLLHWDHIREGKVSGWRSEAVPSEIATLSEICGEWLIAQGYERDHAWAAPAIAHLHSELAALREKQAELQQEIDRTHHDLAVTSLRLDAAQKQIAAPLGMRDALKAIARQVPGLRQLKRAFTGAQPPSA